MFKDRYTVGNVCLVLFCAFILSVIFATVKVPLCSAVSAQPVTMIPSTSATNKYDSATGKVTLQVQLNPVTPVNFSTLKYYVSLLKEDGSTILSSQEFTYGQALPAVYQSAYGKLLELEYTCPGGMPLAPTFTVVYRSVYADPGPSTVYLELTYKPPAAPSGGGGGIAAAGVVATAIGDLTLTSDRAVLNVDPGKFRAAVVGVAPGQAYVLPVGPLSIRPAMEYKIPASILKAHGSLLIQFPGDGAHFVISLDMIETTGEDGDVLTLAISRASDSDASIGFGEVYGVGAGVDFSPASSGYRIETTWTGKSGIRAAALRTTLPQQARLTLKYDPSKVQNPSRLVGVHKDGSGSVSPVKRTVVRQDASEVDLYIDHLSWFGVAQWRKDFPDVTTHWAYQDILAMAARGVAKGMPDGSFTPDAAVTRAQFAALLARTLDGTTATPLQGRFRDVAPWAWYYGAVETAAGAGLAKGYEDGTFRPEARISRQEMATMVVRAMGLLGKATSLDAASVDATLGGFADSQAVASWAREPVAQAIKAGIVTGRTITTFQPTEDSTRAESVVMLRRLLKAAGYIQ
jgi:hypothetical protein